MEAKRWGPALLKIKIHRTKTKEDNQIIKTQITSEECLAAIRARIKIMEAFVTHLTKRTTATSKMIHTTTGTTTRPKITEEARNLVAIKMLLYRIKCTSSSSLHQLLRLCQAMGVFSPGTASKVEILCPKMILQIVL